MYSWNGVDVVRFLRLVRILRLLKLGQKSERLRIIWKAILKSAEGIWLLLLTLPFFVSFFSFILFFAELGNGKIVDGIWYNSLGEKSPIQSMADCFWVVMETTTTVGYGDIVPQTWPGRAVASIVMFLSLFIIAFPLCMITMQYTHYARLFSLQKRANKEAAKMLRERLLATSDEHIAFHAPILPTQSVNSPKVDEHATSDTDTVSTAVHFKLKNSKPLPERSTSALGLATKSMFSGESIFKLRSKSSTNLLNLTPNLVPKSADGVVTSPVDDNGNMSGQDSQPSTPTILASKSIDPELSPPMQLPVSISWSAPPLLHRSDSWTKSRVKPELVTETPLASSPRRSSTSATAGGFKQIANASRELERPMSPMQIMPYRPSSANSRFNIREVERQVDMENLPDGYPDVVLFKVQDWKLEYRADRREDVLVMRVRCKDEDRYRRLMGVLAGFC
ncbi:hypothetical protein BC830DRAFT_1096928 [Chytriomyces sp. MP71]|nr:hypothetical protein BC830DRAFT_1096928 [Chytriomyces sp. MP71]